MDPGLGMDGAPLTQERSKARKVYGQLYLYIHGCRKMGNMHTCSCRSELYAGGVIDQIGFGGIGSCKSKVEWCICVQMQESAVSESTVVWANVGDWCTAVCTYKTIGAGSVHKPGSWCKL